jgi:predicted DNA-binding transcriptional regulator AlpA
MPPDATPDLHALIDADEVRAMLGGISASAFERLKAQNKLPPHVELTRRTHRWRCGDVVKFIEEKLAETVRRQGRPG